MYAFGREGAMYRLRNGGGNDRTRRDVSRSSHRIMIVTRGGHRFVLVRFVTVRVGESVMIARHQVDADCHGDAI